jgi:hypothetical protein
MQGIFSWEVVCCTIGRRRCRDYPKSGDFALEGHLTEEQLSQDIGTVVVFVLAHPGVLLAEDQRQALSTYLNLAQISGTCSN